LDEVVKSLQAQPTVRVRIEGHTDDRGADDLNLTLSQRRALSVMNYLIKAGIDERRVEYTGFGETRPVEDNKTDTGRAKNRRVAFLTLDK
jgi:outer membrane protein OmpA-like peptidoglycan-associated protein